MIRAIIETSLIDWDGKLTTVLFFDACNYRCPFCHNWELITTPNKFPEITWDQIRATLQKKEGWVDGVVLTGGEPLINEKEVIALCRKVQALGIKVKLDTNGAFPNVLIALIDGKLVDYIAMDVKAPLDERYTHAVGKTPDLHALQISIESIMHSGLPYEFRTTCVPGTITAQAIHDIGTVIQGAKKWALQAHVPDNAFKPDCRAPLPPEYPKRLQEFLAIAKQYVPYSILRGKI
jgi:pyruvate formate lyase activating enzyme